MINIATKYVGLDLKSPVIVASAGITEKTERIKKAQDCGAGAVVMKSLFENEISRASPTPRFKVLHHNLNDRKTFSFYSYEQGSEWGPERYSEEIMNAKKSLEIPVIASINCITDDGWQNYARMMQTAGADAVEINVSCPHGSITFTGEEIERQILKTVKLIRNSVTIPLIVKLSPQLTSPLNIVKELEKIGADGVTIFNRLTGLEIDIEDEKPVMHGGYAGHGGPWAMQYPLRWISAIYPNTGMNISASGGVTSGDDVVKYLLAGATAVQVCTAVFINGYEIIPDLNNGLKKFMELKGYNSIEKFRGKICERILAAEKIERKHTLKAKINRIYAPCSFACPVKIDVQGYINLIKQSKFKEALQLIRERIPLAAVCGRVCHHPCEKSCTRNLVDKPLAIMSLKRFVTDLLSKKEYLKSDQLLPKKHENSKVAIIGSGPAGLAAGYDLARLGHEVTVFESLPVAGGMLAVGIPEYRLPKKILQMEIDYLKNLGIEIKTNVHIGSKLKIEDLLDSGYKSVLIAIGLHKDIKLNLPGEKLSGVFQSIEFLRRVNLGEKVKIGKKVAVIGGGNTAVDSARVALRRGAKEVYLLYRRTKTEMPALEEEIKSAEKEGIKIIYLVAPARIIGTNGRVTGIECRHMVLGDYDESGRRKPIPLQNSRFIIKVNNVVVAVGQTSDDNGKIKTTNNYKGIFAAGDIVNNKGTVVEAMSDGKRAAVSIHKYLTGESIEESYSEITPEEIFRIKGYPEKREGVGNLKSKSLAVKETERCLSCGCGLGCEICKKVCIYFAVDFEKGNPLIDSEKCDGCGLCVELCPNNTIEMEKYENKISCS